MTDDDSRELAAEVRVLIGQLVRRLRAEGTLPLGQVSAMGWLLRQGPKTTSQLAELERVRPQSMAHIVGKLRDARLVVGRPDPSDGRQTLIELTPAGRAELASHSRGGEDWLAEAIATHLNARERQVIADAVGLLSRLTGP